MTNGMVRLVEWYLFQFEPKYLGIMTLRLLVACILGGIIGFEREHSQHKPAGFRTHILVSLGSCLVMLISQFAITAYKGTIDIDPTRFGAQVVSGIGFLGAGTIIRHGVSVKGITTAASIWAVACVGLACGIGFYAGAALAILLVWMILIYLKAVEKKINNKGKLRLIEVEAQPGSPVIPELNKLFLEKGMKLKNLEVSASPFQQKQRIHCVLDVPAAVWDSAAITVRIMEIQGVIKVSL